MGVSTGQWRAAIGRWVGAREAAMSSSVGETDSSAPPSFFALVLAVLLIVAGVEPNPGPVIYKTRCELCGMSFESLADDLQNKERLLSEKEKTLKVLEEQLQDRERELYLKEKLLKDRKKLFDEKERVVAEREKVVAYTENALRESGSYVRRRNRPPGEGAAGVGATGEGASAEGVPGVETPTVGTTVVEPPAEGATQQVDPPPTQEEELLKAVCAGHLWDVMAILQNKKVSVEHKYTDRKTPLLWAAENGHLSMVRYLVKEAGACTSARDSANGWSALHWAAHNGHLQVVEYLVSQAWLDVSMMTANKETALHISAHRGHLDIVSLLIQERKEDKDLMDNDGKTALHWAAAAGHLHVVIYLLKEARADKNLATKDGSTALHLACAKNYLDVVICLVDYGIDKAKTNTSGQTAVLLTTSDTVKKFLS